MIEDPNSEIYAVKETVVEFAKREYKALIELKKLGAPSVEAIAVIEGRTDHRAKSCDVQLQLGSYLIPCHTESCSRNSVSEHDINNMANALAYLLVQLHLLGFGGAIVHYQTLFRRDAEGFAAVISVDAETGEFRITYQMANVNTI
jgi:hypothetical protein